ncbi:hypothetical protein [Gilvimarinus algae]|uniref:DUF2059 domain-containing protein n=1 Tax=Gilvimarinus algae TaxID=3058037 RepID=A0ABT8TDL3_9GAMM|nr:hypothetical protein [Gilvimarinus sp. SDUM040014]MDO3382216.1 hypothetical protein [Gilvimarinus sp. SDUM040014]
MKGVTRILCRSLATLVMLVLTSAALADVTLNEKALDNWLATTKDFMPMQEVFESISKDSAIASQYTEEEFKALSLEKQDELLDDMLKEQNAYDKVYKVLNQHDWGSAGDYMRVSSRLGMAIGAHMRDLMMQSLPPEQQQMMREMAGEVDAEPEDVALVSQHWEKISSFMAENMDTSDMPMP